ncbi:hypothetical protein [Winogradskya humida]|uniref:Ig-like domain-containing protein n=1 Tax=Winogradskya humida TaxID=113566 RepID=A0ABQ3ZUE6_9ACTN|nr:hypothetical protein [Actinoplanes humidus]GIE22173.1 hypothetical protein Ahu01nite_052750 [Actinoplanes humidus]
MGIYFAPGVADADVVGPSVFADYGRGETDLKFNVGVPGEFRFSSRDDDTESFVWSIDGDGPSGTTPADATGWGTAVIAPARPGWQTLSVLGVERDGTRSGTTAYEFRVDNGPLVTGGMTAEDEPVLVGATLTYHLAPRRPGVTAYVFQAEGLTEFTVPARADGTADYTWMIPHPDIRTLSVRSRTADGTLSEPRYPYLSVNGADPVITQSGGYGLNMPMTFRALSPMPGVTEYTAVLDNTPSTQQVVSAGPDGSASLQYTVSKRGQHSVVIHAVNASGARTGSRVRTWTASDRPIVTSAEFPLDGAARLAPGTFTFSPRLGGTTAYEYSFGGSPTTLPTDPDGTGTLAWTPPAMGSYSLSVRSLTADGTRSELTAVHTFTVAPRTGTLTSFSPHAVQAGAPRTITLAGTELTAQDKITVQLPGGSSAPTRITSVSADLTTLTFTADLTSAKAGLADIVLHSAATGELAGRYTIIIDPPPALRVTKAPAITGSAKVGAKLTATAGTWTPAATSVKYQWKSNGTAIAGATGSSYTIPASQLGKRLTVTVTASRSGNTTTSTVSAATPAVAKGPAAKATTKPKITGTPKAARTVTATPGTWSPKPTSYKYEWRLNGTLIKGATGKTLKLKSTMRDKKLTVTVIAVRAGYVDGRSTSATVKVRR